MNDPHPPDQPNTREELETQIINLIHQMGWHARTLLLEGLGREKLSLAQWLILDMLADTPDGLPMRQLGAHIGVPASSLTSLVDALADRHWLDRHDDPNDRRIVRVALSPPGMGFVLRVREHLSNTNRQAMKDLSITELEITKKLMTRMLEQQTAYRHRKA